MSLRSNVFEGNNSKFSLIFQKYLIAFHMAALWFIAYFAWNSEINGYLESFALKSFGLFMFLGSFLFLIPVKEIDERLNSFGMGDGSVVSLKNKIDVKFVLMLSCMMVFGFISTFLIPLKKYKFENAVSLVALVLTIIIGLAISKRFDYSYFSWADSYSPKENARNYHAKLVAVFAMLFSMFAPVLMF